MKDIVIIGAGGFGREVAWLINDINKEKKVWNILGFVDDNVKYGTVIDEYKVLGDCSFFNKNSNIYYTCAIGTSRVRKEVVKKVDKEYEIKAATLVHPSAKIAASSVIGDGCIICAENIITVNVNIGNFNIINLNCTIGHDVVCKDFVTICPGVNISGCCTIKDGVEIGTGTKIIQGKKVGGDSILGAGTVVVKDIPDNVTAVGVPAKIIKNLE